MTTKQGMKAHFINKTKYTQLTNVKLKSIQIESSAQLKLLPVIVLRGITMCLDIQNQIPTNISHEQTLITRMTCIG